MRKKLSALQLSFLVSAAVHLAAWQLLPERAGEVRIAGGQSQQKVYLVDARPFRSAPPVRTDAVISMQPKTKLKIKKATLNSQGGADNPFDVAGAARESERGISPASRPQSQPSDSSPQPPETSRENSLEHRAAFSEWFSQIALRCNNIQLPRQWLSLRDFWPRRYEVGFVVDRREGEDRLKLQRMHAIAGEVPALDGRIRDLLTDCLKKYGQNGLATDDWSVLALNRDSGDAYSVTLEFTDGSYSIVSPRGI